MMQSKNNLKGILLMIISSITIASGQFFWKLALGELNIWLLLGFIIYGIGAISMIIAFKYGELSVLHPVMAFSYIVAFLLSVLALHEPWDWTQIAGVLIIMAGIILLGQVKKGKIG